jgi:hypothetical protein
MLTEPPGEALVRTSSYTLPSGRPGWIDLTTLYQEPVDPPLSASASSQPRRKVHDATPGWFGSAPSGRPLHTMAIYAIERHRLTYCVAPPGKPRPTGFVTKEGDGYTLVTLRRQGDSTK